MTDSLAPRLSDRLAAGTPLVVPGVFDALSAVLAERAGFEALFVSGSALSLSQLARPDVGLVTLTELADAVTRIALRVDVPLLVDGDFGFGSALNVTRTIQLLERAGASGIQIEDRLEAASPGLLACRPVVETAVMLDKIAAALDSRVSAGTIISARTDALYSNGLEDALERAQRYAEAGADMVFVEGCVSREARQRASGHLAARCPLLFNAGILPPGSPPSPEELSGLGYAVILFPGAAVKAAASAMDEGLRSLAGWQAGRGYALPGFDVGASINAGGFLARFVR